MRSLRCRLGCCLQCQCWKGFGIYFPHVPMNVSDISSEAWSGSVSLPTCLGVPRARTGCERIRGVAALARVAERERGGRCRSTAPPNRNHPDLKLGQKHDLKHTLRSFELHLLLSSLAAGDRACLIDQKFDIKTEQVG